LIPAKVSFQENKSNFQITTKRPQNTLRKTRQRAYWNSATVTNKQKVYCYLRRRTTTNNKH